MTIFSEKKFAEAFCFVYAKKRFVCVLFEFYRQTKTDIVGKENRQKNAPQTDQA